MAIVFHRYDSGTDEAALRDLLLGWWQHNDWSDDAADRYFNWRYGERPNGETWLASDGRRCVAAIDSFFRPYLIKGRRIVVRETCDWFCRPEYRKAGIGLALMRRMMGEPEPLLVIGGSKATLALLPKLQWSRLQDAQDFVLPLTLGVTVQSASLPWAGGIGRISRLVPNLPLTLPSPRPPLPFPSAEMRVRQLGEDVPATMSDVDGFSPVLDCSTLDWLLRAPPPVGTIRELSFHAEGQSVGLVICRIKTQSFGKTASILHLHTTYPKAIEWMVSRTVSYLRERGVGFIRCRSSSPQWARALRKRRFLPRTPQPAYWWSRTTPAPDGPMQLTLLRADDAFAA